MPCVSVIMAAYHEAPQIVSKAIESVLNQTFLDFELVIVLDDPDNKDLQGLLYQYASHDSRIVLLVNERNIGLASSLNKALQIAKGEFICRMDADDISISNRIEQQLHYLNRKEYDLIGGYVNLIDENGDFLYSVTNLPIDSKDVHTALKYNNCVPHPTWFGRKEVFSEGYRNIPLCEDYDFLLRATMHGAKIGNLDYIVLNYRQTSNSISRNSLFRQYLFQVFLSRCYSAGNVAKIDDAIKYVDNHYSRLSDSRYCEANRLFNAGITGLHEKHYFPAIVGLSRIPFTSLHYCRKILRMFRAVLSI